MSGDRPEQMREDVRVDVTLPVDVVSDDGEAPFTTKTINVSGGGMLLNAVGLRLGTRIRFRLHLDDGKEPIEGRARVVGEWDDCRRGLKFEPLPRADEQRLIRFIFELQRIALAKTRAKMA